MLRELLMDRARELAERGRYTVAPNPLVGAVVVREGEVVGEGWHVRPGEDHAEAMALQRAGRAARGAAMHVTLEPCNRHIRTPGATCTEAILRAGIRRVVIGHRDPNPSMCGRSVEILEDSGVEVEVLDDAAIEQQNEQHFWSWRTGRPFVHLKLATTLDGRIAAAGGDSRWITGETARLRAHHLRAEAGAVLVGAGTVQADDPLLVVRGLSEAPPEITRVVLDPHLRTGAQTQLVRTACDAPLVIFADAESLDGRERRLTASGAEVIVAPRSNGRGPFLDLSFVLEELGRRGIRGVLVEGGGRTAGRFVEEGLANKLTLFYAPKILGSRGVPMIGDLHVTRVADASRFVVSEVERLDEDVALTLYPSKPGEEYVYGVD